MKALIAMSGGVDSSVAAMLMIEAGYECVGCTMKLWSADGEDDSARPRACCTLDDTLDARSVAARLGMPFYVFNFKDDFRNQVIDKFVCSYAAGLTPNPCIDCNRYMKFGKLFDRADVLECDKIATGHYARIERAEDGRFLLKKALDPTKDQSYVLYMLGQRELSRLEFPLGSMRKTKVRELAAKHGFINADKPDSQDICFVPDGDYASVIEKHGVVCEPGDFVTEDGRVLGRHRGIIHYTVGQRRGLGIAAEHPLYVLGVDVGQNRVILGSESDLYSDRADLTDVCWVAGTAPSAEFRCRAKIRYRKPEQDATVRVSDDRSVRIIFDEPQRSVCPGQAAVLYDGDTVLGGGTIAGSVSENAEN